MVVWPPKHPFRLQTEQKALGKSWGLIPLVKDGGIHSDHVYGLNWTQRQSRKGAACALCSPQKHSALLGPSWLPRGPGPLDAAAPICSHPCACLPWRPRKSSGKASFLIVPFYPPGLLIKPRSHVPENVCLHASLPHGKMNSLQQG